MFYVRSARALPPPSLESEPSRARRLRRRHPTPSCLPGRTSSPHHMPAFRHGSARRRSTSRSAWTRPRSRPCTACSTCAPRVPWPPRSPESSPPRACRLRHCHPQRPHASRAAPRRASHARPSTRQSANAFNQALSFDMSSVTNSNYMFTVRSARAPPPPSLESCRPPPRVHAACAAVAPRPRTPHHRMFPPFDSAGDLGGAAHLVGVGKLRLAQLSELQHSPRCA